MIKIYCIEDINDLKYVGSTGQKLVDRLSQHRYTCRPSKCSSRELNLYNCIIYTLEECVEDQRKERERYWINKLECVNLHKLNGIDIEKANKRKREYAKEYRKNNREEVNRKKKEYMRVFRKRLKEGGLPTV